MAGEFICSSLGIAFSSIVFLFFAFVSFESRFRFSILKTGLLVFSITIVNVAVDLIWLFARAEYPSYSVLAIIAGVVYAIAVFLITIRGRYFEELFILLVLLNAFSDVAVISRFIVRLSTWEISPYIAWGITQAGILIIYIPLLWVLVFKLYKPVIDLRIQYSALRLIWVVPALFYIIFRVKILSDYGQRITHVFEAGLVLSILWAICSYLFFLVVLLLLNRKYENMASKEQISLITAQLKMQEEQYEQLSKSIDESVRIRHDWRHHLLILSGLAKEQKQEEMKQYLNDLMPVYLNEEETPICESHVVNIILRHYKAIARELDITMKINADIPWNVAVSELDLCVIFGNLVENAIEACSSQSEEDKFISIKAAMKEKSLVVMIKNTYGKKVMVKDNVYYSTRHEGAGSGLLSVRHAVEKNNGYMQLKYDENYFYVNIMMNINGTEN